MTLHFRDRRVAASLCCRNRADITVLKCEHTAVFSVVTQRSSPLTSGEERCVTTLKTAVWQTVFGMVFEPAQTLSGKSVNIALVAR